ISFSIQGATIRFVWDKEDYSFIFRYVYSDRAKMGVSKMRSYKEYQLDEDKKYNLNLDDAPGADLSVLPNKLHLGAGDFTFSLTNIPDKKPIITLPFLKKTVTPDTADSSADLEAEPAEEEDKEEDVFSEGVLEFIESLNMKKSAPLWAGIGLALLIILLGLGLYFLVTRKDEKY
ncbi:hypothetical protein ACFL3V_06725, partial [Nanoarchaeota archaeon]